MNYTESWNTTVSVFTLTIWNLTAEDSSFYRCYTSIYPNNGTAVVYSYNVQVIDCACSAVVSSLIKCLLNNFATEDYILIHININKNRNAKSLIRPPNEFFASHRIFEEDRINDIEIQVSLVQSSTTYIDVVCVLPALDQASPPSSPLLSAASTPTMMILAKWTDDSLRATTSSDITYVPETVCLESTPMGKKVVIIVVTLSGALLLGMVIVMFFWKRKINNHKPACCQARRDLHKKTTLELLTARQPVGQAAHDDKTELSNNRR